MGHCRCESLDFDAMNHQYAHRCLSEYVARVEQAQRQPMLSKDRRATMKAVHASLDLVNYCLRDLVPDIEPISGSFLNDNVWALPRVRRAIELLNRWQQIASQDDAVPALPLDMLDWVVSSVAIPLWKAGKFRQAVSDAATSLSHFAQQRLGRHDVSDTPLMTEAFSNDPPKPGKPRLRCPGGHSLVTVKDQQNGARQIATGAFLAIRNPAHHLTGDWNPVTAFHYLAILSQVAHYFRHWDVDRYVSPPPDLNVVMAQYQKSLAQQQKPVTVPGKTSA
jgi:Protein of unknown function (Hypoth_ymh)